MLTRGFLIHALSPLHAGTGHAAEVIDLPTARMKSTGIPIVPGSSIKGVLRDARNQCDAGQVQAVFGPTDDPSLHAGALVVSDARLLALPVRSFRGTFAWTTSPLLLALACRELNAGQPDDIPAIEGHGALVSPGCACFDRSAGNTRLYLEELDLPAREDTTVQAWAAHLAKRISPGHDIFSKRFVVVDDDTMAFLCETALQVDARVRLDAKTGTVASGALWLEESLPPETLLVGILGADRSRRRGVTMTPEQVLDFALSKETLLQLGGKATTGRGRCRLLPMHDEKGAQ